MGFVTYALSIHQRTKWSGRHRGLAPAIALLEESHDLGAGGIQCPLSVKDVPHVGDLRGRLDRYEMHFEAMLSLPSDQADVARFESDVQVATEAGASVARTIIMPGRRYEQCKSLAEFRELEARGRQSLQWAEPVVARHRLRLAIENHKDQRVPERLALLDSLSSEWIGMCVDVGNSLALLEKPLDTVRAFAPYAFTVHLKDVVARESDDGFWMADTALGEGMLDLPEMMQVLRQANPAARYYLETMTRDALPIPAKTEGYWVTMDGVPRSDLDAILQMLRTSADRAPLPKVSELPPEQQLSLERHNVQQSLQYAREKLSLVTQR